MSRALFAPKICVGVRFSVRVRLVLIKASTFRLRRSMMVRVGIKAESERGDAVDSKSFPSQQMGALRKENSSLKNMVKVRDSGDGWIWG